SVGDGTLPGSACTEAMARGGAFAVQRRRSRGHDDGWHRHHGRERFRTIRQRPVESAAQTVRKRPATVPRFPSFRATRNVTWPPFIDTLSSLRETIVLNCALNDAASRVEPLAFEVLDCGRFAQCFAGGGNEHRVLAIDCGNRGGILTFHRLEPRGIRFGNGPTGGGGNYCL